jgi:hypothetical protein
METGADPFPWQRSTQNRSPLGAKLERLSGSLMEPQRSTGPSETPPVRTCTRCELHLLQATMAL